MPQASLLLICGWSLGTSTALCWVALLSSPLPCHFAGEGGRFVFIDRTVIVRIGTCEDLAHLSWQFAAEHFAIVVLVVLHESTNELVRTSALPLLVCTLLIRSLLAARLLTTTTRPLLTALLLTAPLLTAPLLTAPLLTAPLLASLLLTTLPTTELASWRTAVTRMRRTNLVLRQLAVPIFIESSEGSGGICHFLG
jgi:hypothetical protein